MLAFLWTVQLLILQGKGKDVQCPSRNLLLGEDGDLSGQRLTGLTLDGYIFPFAVNNVVLGGERDGLTGDFRGAEWAGATFDPTGKRLFVNNFTAGIISAITGQWARGSL